MNTLSNFSFNRFKMSKPTISLLQRYLKFIKSGQGFESTMNKVKITYSAEGCCNAEFTVLPEHTNYYGYLHGGFSATLVDIISGAALLTHPREGAGVSAAMSLSYLKSAKIGDIVIVEAKTIKAGKYLGFLEVSIKNKDTGDLLVTAAHTKFIRHPLV